MAIEFGSELTCSMGVKDMTASIAWYERVLQCKLLYRADEIGWCELSTPMAGVNIGLSEVESVVQGGGATNVFEVADIETAKAHLDAEGVRQDGDIQHIPGLVKLITFYDPDGNAFMFFAIRNGGVISLPWIAAPLRQTICKGADIGIGSVDPRA